MISRDLATIRYGLQACLGQVSQMESVRSDDEH